MVRYVTKRRGALRTSERAERAKKLRVRKQAWVDPFPLVHGTLPEKMVYAELSRRGIPFLFLNDQRFEIPEIGFDKYYQADFILPGPRIIIEVNGSYWHSMEKTIQADAFKYSIYQITGWTVLAWWDYDIYARLGDLFSQTPVLAAAGPAVGRGSSELPVQRRTKVDTSKGIRTLNQRRAQRLAYKKKAARQRYK